MILISNLHGNIFLWCESVSSIMFILSVISQTFGFPCLGPEVVDSGLEKEADVHYRSVKHDRRIGHRDVE